MNKYILIMLFILAIPTALSQPMLAGQTCTTEVDPYHDSLVLFYSYTCPHCHSEIAFIEEDVKRVYPDLDVHMFEVTRPENSDNMKLYESFAEAYNTSSSGVPRTFINGKVYVGFDKGEGNSTYAPSYKAYIGFKNQLKDEIDVLAEKNGMKKAQQWDGTQIISPWYSFIIILLYSLTYFMFRDHLKDKQKMRYWLSGLVASFIISFFIFMTLLPDATISNVANKMPFGLFVFIIALADGFNPCAFTVLFILLSLLTYTKTKRIMFHVGNTFVITSAIMYFIFIMLMIVLGKVLLEQYGVIVLKIIGVIVLIAGTINPKDFIFFKKGVSLSISDGQKMKITHHARRIVQRLNESKGSKAFWLAILSTIVLAFGVNIVELGCSAILPTFYMTTLLGKYGMAIGLPHILWTLFYAVIYIIPLYAILLNFLFTFRSDRITEDQGRILKLVAGIFMFIFGIIMVLKPTILMG